MATILTICFVITSVLFCSTLSQRPINPSIIQDSRNLPQTDGTFGFLYRTEDGISHAAVGKPGGEVQGRFTYTDPTGLKVNYNYNAGSRAVPGLNYEQNQPQQRTSQSRTQSYESDDYYNSAPEPQTYAKSQSRTQSYESNDYYNSAPERQTYAKSQSRQPIYVEEENQ